MFQKLMKYEWKSYVKSMLFLLIGVFSITLIGVISIYLFDTDNFDMDSLVGFFNLTSYIGIFFLYYFGLIACSLVVSLLIAIRYYKTMFTDEGYLTHTLPVTRSQLYWSKLLAAFGYQVYTLVLVLLSVVAVVSTVVIRLSSLDGFCEELSELFSDMIADMGMPLFTFYTIFYILFILISSFVGVIIMYACITLGQLFRKHRIIGAIIAYFIVTIAMQVLMVGISFISAFLSNGFSGSGEFTLAYYNLYYGLSFVMIIVIGVVLYIITNSQLKKNLNLE